MALESRDLRAHRWCDLEMSRLQVALDIESRHNALMAGEVARLGNALQAERERASQAEREREEATVEVTRLLNLLVAQAVTEAARVLPVVVA